MRNTSFRSLISAAALLPLMATAHAQVSLSPVPLAGGVAPLAISGPMPLSNPVLAPLNKSGLPVMQQPAPSYSAPSKASPNLGAAMPVPQPARQFAPVAAPLPAQQFQQPYQQVQQQAAPENVTPVAGPSMGHVVPSEAPKVSAILPGEYSDNGAVMRHLPNNIQGYRLLGEIGGSEWPVYLTDAQARQKLRFQVGYLAAISAMPEASTLTVSINDTVIGQTRIKAPSSVKTASFDVPPGIVRPGFNSVRINVEQRHRVDCSLVATYELWTQIDPSQTGLIVPAGDTGVTNISELAALPADSQGALPIRAVIPGKTSITNIEHIIRAVQMISLIGRFEQPVVDFGGLAEGKHGINLLIGVSTDIARQIPLETIGSVGGPKISVIPASATRRTTIVVTGVTPADVEEALKLFTIATDIKGSEAGLRAAASFPGYRVTDGQRVRLRDVGLQNQEFSGRFFKAAFNIIMPPDFYTADYAKVMLDLDGGYAPGLTTEAQIVVSMNGRNAASLKLPKSSGDVFQQNAIPLPLGLLRPGLNRIEIEAQVPVASDETCDPLAAINGKKRFLFLDTTEIVLPRVARIAKMPDLAVTATGGFPYGNSKGQPKLYVPAPDRETIGAAATIAARIAIAAGRPIDFKMTMSMPEKGSGSTLVVGPARALNPELLALTGLNPETIKNAWINRVDTPKPTSTQLTRAEYHARNRLVLQRNFPAACHMAKPSRGYAAAADAPTTLPLAPNRSNDMPVAASSNNGPNSHELFDEWNKDVRGRGRWLAGIKQAYADTSNWASDKVSAVNNWVGSTLQNTKKEADITPQSSLVIAQNILGDTSDDVWTLVTAPTSAILGESVGCLADPRVWSQIGGRVSILDASEGSVSRIASNDARFIATQPLSVDNIRLITASWLSLNQTVYVFAALLIAGLLCVSTTWLLRNVGRKQE